MNENLEQLREIAQNAAALETEHGYTLPYVEAMRLMYGHLRASTVLALIDRVEAAEQALDVHTQRDRELKTLLSTLSDRLDEFCYDELSSLIEDEPLNQWSEKYTSKLQAAEQAVERVREAHFPDEDGDCDFCVNYYCDTRKAEYPCPTIRALDGGEQE